jgi:hypothetical protein
MEEKKTGRPTKYTEELAHEICRRIAEGESIRKICDGDDMPSATTIFNWLLDTDKKAFLEQYNASRAIQAENMFDELLEIADKGQGEIMRDRLRVDTRKWYLSKVLPKKFGEKIDMTTDGKALPAPIYGGISIQNDNGDA